MSVVVVVVGVCVVVGVIWVCFTMSTVTGYVKEMSIITVCRYVG